MKKQKTLIIVVLIVAILAVGIYMAMALTGGSDRLVAGLSSEKTKEIINMEDIVYVQYTNETETVTLVKTDSTWKSEENPELVLVDDYVEERVRILGQVEGELVVGAKAAKCGLDTPDYKLTIKNADQEITAYFGIGDDGNYYAMLDGESRIYEIDEDVIQVVQKGISDYEEVKDGMNAYYMNQDDQETEEETKEAEGQTSTTTTETEETTTGDDEELSNETGSEE